MSFPIVDASSLGNCARYPRHSWPIEHIHPGQAFVIPMAEGEDQDGRSEPYIRTYIHKIGARLRKSFSVNKLSDGDLAVTRIA
jgi:hypothetical protein